MHHKNKSLDRDNFSPPKSKTRPRPPTSSLGPTGLGPAKGITIGDRRNKHKPTFPEMVYQILQDSAIEGTEDAVAWTDNGTSFHIHKPREFNDNILPKYSRKKTKFRSFQRQLNIYGFKMAKKSGVYRHELFRRGDVHSMFQIRPRSTLKKKTNERDGKENENEVKSSVSLNAIPTPPLMPINDEGNRLLTNPTSFVCPPPLLRSISLEKLEPEAERNPSICSSEDAGGAMPFVGVPIHVASLGQNHVICSTVPGGACFDLFDDMEGINYCNCNGCGCCFT